jgi:mRNA interferase MazF
MLKDYKNWMPIKINVNNKGSFPKGYKEREIWYASIGENIGFEEDGKGKTFARPVLVLKGFSKNLCCIIPLSTTKKRGKFYYAFDGKTGKMSVALLSQIKIIDTKRLRHKIGTMAQEDFVQIKDKIKQVFTL